MSLMLHMCVFREGYLALDNQLLYSSHPLLSSIAYGSLCRTKASWACPIHFDMSIGVYLVQFMGGHAVET